MSVLLHVAGSKIRARRFSLLLGSSGSLSTLDKWMTASPREVRADGAAGAKISDIQTKTVMSMASSKGRD